jgi:hypothetical protein
MWARVQARREEGPLNHRAAQQPRHMLLHLASAAWRLAPDRDVAAPYLLSVESFAPKGGVQAMEMLGLGQMMTKSLSLHAIGNAIRWSAVTMYIRARHLLLREVVKK